MILDKDLVMSDNQAPGNIGANSSTSVLNLGAGPGDARDALTLVVSIPTTIAATGGAATIAFALHDSADDSSFAATPISVAATSKDNLGAGTVVIKQRLPIGVRQYVKMVYTVGTNNITSGGIDAYLVREYQSNR